MPASAASTAWRKEPAAKRARSVSLSALRRICEISSYFSYCPSSGSGVLKSFMPIIALRMCVLSAATDAWAFSSLMSRIALSASSRGK